MQMLRFILIKRLKRYGEHQLHDHAGRWIERATAEIKSAIMWSGNFLSDVTRFARKNSNRRQSYV